MNDSTKHIILQKAHKLFADKGFNGVSVREIAKICDVNVAAINYHFKNKENLYNETVIMSINETENEVHQLYDSLEEKSVESLTLAVFDHFRANSEDLRTGFKLILTGDHPSNKISADIAKFKGPPGGEYFFKVLSEEFPNASIEDKDFAVRTLFTQVIHKAIVMCNSGLCEQMEKIGLNEDSFKKDLLRLVKLIKNELK